MGMQEPGSANEQPRAGEGVAAAQGYSSARTLAHRTLSVHCTSCNRP